MPGRQAKPGPTQKDRLPGAVTTHASPPLLSRSEVWALAAFLASVLLCVVALEGWASRPPRTPSNRGAGQSATHPLLAPPVARTDEIDLSALSPGQP